MARDVFMFGTFDANDGVTYQIADGTRFTAPAYTSEFVAHVRSGQPTRTFTGQRYVMDPGPVHPVNVLVVAATRTALETAIAALDAAVVPTVDYIYRHRDSSVTVSRQVRHVSRQAPAFISDVEAVCSYEVETLPGWKRTTSTTVTGTIEGAPCDYVDVPGVVGTMPAECIVKATSEIAATALLLGIRSGAAVTPYQDYQGDATYPNAISGEAAKSATLTASYAAVGSAAALDMNAYAGRYFPIARVLQSDATPADTTYKFRSSVAGSGIADSANVDTPVIAASKTSAQGYEYIIGDAMSVPAAEVPNAETGSGLADDGVVVSQATDDGTKTLTSLVGSGTLKMRQSFAAFNGLMTAFEYTVDVAPSQPTGEPHLPELSIYRNGVRVALVRYLPMTVGTHKIVLPVPVSVSASDTLYAELFFQQEAQFTVGFAYGNNRYASGALTTPYGSGEDATDDLVFAVYGQQALGFNCTLALLAANSGGGNAYLDATLALPCDEPYIAAWHGFGAGEGFIADGHKVVKADADGVGASIIYRSDGTRVERNGLFELRPGDNRILGVAFGGGTAVPGDIPLEVEYWPMWELPPGV